MKNFQTILSLHRYLELGGELKPNQMLLCLGKCRFISKRMKTYRDRDGVNHGKVLHYKVEVLEGNLYPKGKIMDCYDTELEVPLIVETVDEFYVK